MRIPSIDNMREIEIKASISDKQALVNVLRDKGVELSPPITQRDQVYGRPGIAGGSDNKAPWLRIRSETKNGNTVQIFTLKKSVTNQLDSIEYETEVADDKELGQIITHLGFEPYSDLTKTRQKAQLGDIEICVDTVDGLGDFIEVEKLTDEDANYEEVVVELWEVLERFGVNRNDQVTDGYDVLMRKHQGLEG